MISFSVYCSCPTYRCLLYIMLSDLKPFLSCPCNKIIQAHKCCRLTHASQHHPNPETEQRKCN